MTLQSNVSTKKRYKEVAVGRQLFAFAFMPGPFQEKTTGIGLAVEGPYPVHKWYAQVDVDEDGVVTKVK